MQVIKNKEIIADTWQTLDADVTSLPADGDLLMSLSTWQNLRDKAIAHTGKVGVALTGSESIDDLLSDLDHIDLIALEFPLFKNGQHYSSARLLRDRYGYKGEVRAYGDVNRDQLFYLCRVGFDAFKLKSDADLNEALKAFEVFSVTYQASHDQPLPLYRRR